MIENDMISVRSILVSGAMDSFFCARSDLLAVYSYLPAGVVRCLGY